MEEYQIQIEVENSFGKFKSGKSLLSQENYKKLIDMSKTFYLAGGFELTSEDNTYIVFPPDVVKKSILKIYAIKIENVQE
jgi:hypothetical protein